MHKIDHIQVNLIQIKLDFAEHIQNTDVQIADFCWTPYIPCFRKKAPTHIIGYKLKNSCLILIIFDIKIPHII